MTNAARRAKFRIGLYGLYLPVYDFLCANLSAEWAPYFGIRSIDDQEKLYAKGRTEVGKKVTNAKGGESPHNYGCASDWTIFVQEKPVWELPKSEWDFFGDIARRSGGVWGGDFIYLRDKPHVELAIRVPWTKVNEERISHGMEAARRCIQGNYLGKSH